MITLKEWSIRQGKNPDYGRILYNRGKLDNVQKVGKILYIDTDDELDPVGDDTDKELDPVVDDTVGFINSKFQDRILDDEMEIALAFLDWRIAVNKGKKVLMKFKVVEG